jgi:ABC-type dipeptide/oligopeptide/nickel transport system permease component
MPISVGPYSILLTNTCIQLLLGCIDSTALVPVTDLADRFNCLRPEGSQDALRHLILPTIVLGTVPLAVVARMTRSSMLEVLEEDYVRTARPRASRPSVSLAFARCATR